MNTKLRRKAKNNFQKDFFKLINNAVFGRTMKNLRNYRDIKLVSTKTRINYLVSEPNYQTAKFFTETLLAIETKIQNFVIWIQIASLFMEKHDIYKDIEEDIETRFDTSNFELDGQLPKGKRKVIGLMKYELSGVDKL